MPEHDRTEHVSLRTTKDIKGELNQRAKAYGLDLTNYLIRAGLGQLGPDPEKTAEIDDLERRLDEHEDRLARVEAATFPET
jgi:hypothetical protein